jgi:hypothetical protein
MFALQEESMPNHSATNTLDGAMDSNRDNPKAISFPLAIGNNPPPYQATAEDGEEKKDEDQQHHAKVTSEQDQLYSDSSATYTASDNADRMTSKSLWNNSSDSSAHTEAYPSSPPPMPDLPDDTALEAQLEAFLQARMLAIRAIRGPLPTNYEHLDFYSPGYQPAPRFQFQMKPNGYLPLSQIRRDLYILNAIYPEHCNLFVLILKLFDKCDPQDEMVLRTINALPHMRYLVGLCRTCFLVVGGGSVCCGQVIPE